MKRVLAGIKRTRAGSVRGFSLASEIMRLIEQWNQANVPIGGILYTYALGEVAKLSKPQACQKIHELLLAKKITITVFHYNALMQGHLLSRDYEAIKGYWALVNTAPLRPDAISYTLFLRASVKHLTKVELINLAAEFIHKFDNGKGRVQEVAYTIIAAHIPFKAGMVLLRALEKRGRKPGIRFYTALLSAILCDNVDAPTARQNYFTLRKHVKGSGVILDVVFFTKLLEWQQLQGSFDGACEVLKAMDRHHIVPTVIIYNRMLQICTAEAKGDPTSPAADLARRLFQSAKLQGFGVYNSLSHEMVHFFVSTRDDIGLAKLRHDLHLNRAGAFSGKKLEEAIHKGIEELRRL